MSTFWFFFLITWSLVTFFMWPTRVYLLRKEIAEERKLRLDLAGEKASYEDIAPLKFSHVAVGFILSCLWPLSLVVRMVRNVIGVILK